MGYHRRMIPRREAMMQLARLAGLGEFLERFGSPQTAEPDPGKLAALVEERLDIIAEGLVAEAAASDDVIDRDSAKAFLEDRLAILGGLLLEDHQTALREAFDESTKDW